MMDFIKNLVGLFGGNSQSNAENSSENAKNSFTKGGYNSEEGVYYAKGSYNNAIEYNNEIVCIVENTQSDMTEMNKAMTAKDFNQAEKVRVDWINRIEEYKKQAKDLGLFAENSSLLDAANDYFNGVKKVLEVGYKKLIEIRLAGNMGSAEDTAQRDENNATFAKLQENFNHASDEYLLQFDDDGMPFNTEFENFTSVKHDDNNPMLQDVHGISLQDYATAAYYLANGTSTDEICKVLGVEKPIFEEAGQIWTQRMQEDTSMAVMSLYGQYFGNPSGNAKFASLSSASSANAGGNDNVAKINSDEKFYYEVSAAQMAAYEAGLDGAQWVKDNFGISIADLSSAGMKWMSNTANIGVMMNYQENKKKEYAEKIAKSNGGSVADDIEF